MAEGLGNRQPLRSSNFNRRQTAVPFQPSEQGYGRRFARGERQVNCSYASSTGLERSEDGRVLMDACVKRNKVQGGQWRRMVSAWLYECLVSCCWQIAVSLRHVLKVVSSHPAGCWGLFGSGCKWSCFVLLVVVAFRETSSRC
jgi:hypothetical protein